MIFENFWANVIVLSAFAPTIFTFIYALFANNKRKFFTENRLEIATGVVGIASVVGLVVGYTQVLLVIPITCIADPVFSVILALAFAVLLAIGFGMIMAHNDEGGEAFPLVIATCVPLAIAMLGFSIPLLTERDAFSHTYILAMTCAESKEHCLSTNHAGTDFLFAKEAYFLPAKALLEPFAVTMTIVSTGPVKVVTAVIGLAVKAGNGQAKWLMKVARGHVRGREPLPDWLWAERQEIGKWLSESLSDMAVALDDEMSCGSSTLLANTEYRKKKREAVLEAGKWVVLGRMQEKARTRWLSIMPDAISFYFPQ